jgi:hypothetical protein
MAENRENIFIGVLDALRRNKSGQSDPVTTQTQRVQVLDARSSGSSREQAQQQFLDMQVHKIANDIYSRTIYFDTDRVSAYQDYEAMDHSPEVRQALNIMRDECLTPNEYGEILQIYSDQDRVKSALKDLFVNRLNANFMLKLWIRETLKYGDHFVYLNVNKDQGITGIRDLPVSEVFREEGYDDDINSVRFRWEAGGEYFEEFQVAHFRLLEDTKRIPYGRSILDAARKTWKQLQLAEDALLVYRITRAPDRRVFYIEVGNLDMADVGPYIQAMQRSVKKAAIVDQRTGNKDYKYNPQNVTEDFFLPVRGDHHSRIDTLPGASNLGDIQDIEYLENKLFCSLVVPKAYLNFAEGLQGGTTLSQSDIRFARTIIGFQESMLMELTRVAKIHLLFLGYKDDYENFELRLNNPSTQLELMKLEIMKARLEVAKEWHSMDANSFASWTWVMENILGFSKNDIKKMLKQKKVEKKLFAEIDAGAETYRKTGIFADIDSKYEIAGADPNGGTETEEGGGGGEGGFGGGSSLGDDGTGAGMGGEMPDLGGSDGGESGGPSSAGGPPSTGASPESAPEMALGESKIIRQKETFETRVDSLFEDEDEKSRLLAISKNEKNGLLEKSNAIIKGADSLFIAIQRKFGDEMSERGRHMIKEAPLVPDPNSPLLQDYNEHTSRLAEIIEKMEQQGIEDADEVILPDNTVIEEQSDEEISE